MKYSTVEYSTVLEGSKKINKGHVLRCELLPRHARADARRRRRMCISNYTHRHLPYDCHRRASGLRVPGNPPCFNFCWPAEKDCAPCYGWQESGTPLSKEPSRRVPTALSLPPYIYFFRYRIFTKNNTDVQCRSDKGTAEALPPHYSGGESLRLICHTLHTQRARSPVPPFPRGNAYKIKNTPFSFFLSLPFFDFLFWKKCWPFAVFFFLGICMTFMPLVVPVHNT